jgi:hypothetical protein
VCQFKKEKKKKNSKYFGKIKNTDTQNVVEEVLTGDRGGLKLLKYFSSNLELPIRCQLQIFRPTQIGKHRLFLRTVLCRYSTIGSK